MSGRFDDTLHMYPVARSVMSGLRLHDLLSTAFTDPTVQSSIINEAIDAQQQYEREEEEKRKLLRRKYEYVVSCMNRFACNYSIDFSVITSLDAMFLFQEVLSQMSSYYGFEQLIRISEEIEELEKSISFDESAQDRIALLTEKKVSHRKMSRVVMYNKGYMIHYFTQKWMARYPETDKTKLQKDLELSYKAMNIMYGLSPKGEHTERIDEMNEFEIDSKQEWFVDYEQFKKDVEEFPEFAIYRGMDYD
jgi:hypothetical protein